MEANKHDHNPSFQAESRRAIGTEAPACAAKMCIRDRPQINQDAVRLIKQLYGIDMEQTQYSKLLNELPPVDIVITMGCNEMCIRDRKKMGWYFATPSSRRMPHFRAP